MISFKLKSCQFNFCGILLFPTKITEEESPTSLSITDVIFELKIFVKLVDLNLLSFQWNFYRNCLMCFINLVIHSLIFSWVFYIFGKYFYRQAYHGFLLNSFNGFWRHLLDFLIDPFFCELGIFISDLKMIHIESVHL